MAADEGIVGYEPTNAPIETILLKRIVVSWQTINQLKKDEERYGVLVGQLKTIVTSPISGEIVTQILEREVYVVPTIILALDQPYYRAKPYVYEVNKTLQHYNIVAWTPYKAYHPDPTHPGPRPHFYKLSHLELKDREDPLIRQAQRDFEASLLQFDPGLQVKQSARNLLIDVSLKLVDYYESRDTRPGNYGDIITAIRTRFPEVEPRDRQQVADLFRKRFFHREGGG